MDEIHGRTKRKWTKRKIYKSRRCGFCGKWFVPNNGKAMYCGNKCRSDQYQLTHKRVTVRRRKRAAKKA